MSVRRGLKRFEQTWKALFIRSAAALMRGKRPPPAPDWDSRPHRVLYLRHDRIGDMILATSLIRTIATSHPTLTLDVLASPANAPVLGGEEHVGSVVVFDKWRPSTYLRTFRELRRARYDAVIDCMVLHPSVTTLLLMWASGAPHRIGVGGRSNDPILTIRVAPAEPDAHHIEHNAVLVRAFGVDPARVDWRPVITLSDMERQRAEQTWAAGGAELSVGDAPNHVRRLLVNISASRTRRHWADEHYVAVLRHVRARAPEMRIIVIGALAEAERVKRVAFAGGAEPVMTPRLRDALALVATADLVFTPDTSISHAASAFRTPSLVMLPRGLERLFAPYHLPGRTVLSEGRTLESLPPELVIAAFDELLDDAPAIFASGS
jgi:ADP-heptose:LPS heptosyltransferase